MFDAHCPRCDTIRLLPISRLRRLVNSPLGIEVSLQCYCGEVFELLLGQGPRLPLPTAEGPRRTDRDPQPSRR